MLKIIRAGALALAGVLACAVSAHAACPTAPTFSTLTGQDFSSTQRYLNIWADSNSPAHYWTTPILHGWNGTAPAAVNIDTSCNLDVNIQAGTVAATSTIGAQATNTPTISTSAYVSGYVLGGIQTFTVPNSGFIQNAIINFNSGGSTSQVDLILMNASPTGGGTTDHAAVALTSTDMGKIIGVIHVADCTATSSATTTTCQALGTAFSYKLPSTNTSLFVVAVIRGAPTFTGASDATFGLFIPQ